MTVRLAPYAAAARASARRYAGYRAAAAAGALTNTVFGLVRAYVLLQVWRQRPSLGGYDATAAVTFVFLGQALIASMALFGGGTDLPERVRTGAVVMDLARPVSLHGWTAAEDAGRAAVQLVLRGVPPLLVAAALFRLRLPETPGRIAAVAVTLALGWAVSFGVRYLVALASFWLLDQRGPQYAYMLVCNFFSGMTIPLVLLSGRLGHVARVLPFAAMMQVPGDVFIGVRHGASLATGIAFQAGWAAVLVVAGALLTRRARRKVIVQGG